jgi:nicotinamidase-related amidase
MIGLLIVDMQKGGFKSETPRFDADGVINRINLLADCIRERGDKVIFIQHDGTKENACLPGTDDWEILPAIRRDESDLTISKIANDPFYRSQLQSTLEEWNIDELMICGWATDFCVDAAIRAALSKDYKVVVVKDGHTTGHRPHLSAEQIIEHYNWAWENLTPCKAKVRVLDFETLKSELSSGVQEKQLC